MGGRTHKPCINSCSLRINVYSTVDAAHATLDTTVDWAIR